MTQAEIDFRLDIIMLLEREQIQLDKRRHELGQRIEDERKKLEALLRQECQEARCSSR